MTNNDGHPIRASILVVDDDAAIRESFEAVLAKDYDLLFAAQGPEALRPGQQIRQHPGAGAAQVGTDAARHAMAAAHSAIRLMFFRPSASATAAESTRREDYARDGKEIVRAAADRPRPLPHA